jgi:hypothetical protein
MQQITWVKSSPSFLALVGWRQLPGAARLPASRADTFRCHLDAPSDKTLRQPRRLLLTDSSVMLAVPMHCSGGHGVLSVPAAS